MRRHQSIIAAALLVAAVGTTAATAATAAPTAIPAAERLQARAYAQAVDHFRQGRFPAAYGRFIHLADSGHAPSARHALWMCEQGLSLFGHEWDCAPEQVADWAALAGVAAPAMAPRVERRPLAAPRWRPSAERE